MAALFAAPARGVTRRRSLAVALVAALLAGLLGLLAGPPALAAVGDRPTATWNMQGGSSAQTDKWQTGVAYLAYRADVVALQEAGPTPPPPVAGTQVETFEENSPTHRLEVGRNADGRTTVLPPGVGSQVTHSIAQLGHDQALQRHVYWLATDRAANRNQWGESENRVNLAIVSSVQADQVALIPNQLARSDGANPYSARAALGIRIGDTWYFDLHGFSGSGNDDAGLLSNISDFVDSQPLAVGAPHWIALGDYNRDPGTLTIPAGTQLYNSGNYTHNLFGQSNSSPRELDYGVGTAPANGVLVGRVLNNTTIAQMADHVPVFVGPFRGAAEPRTLYLDATVESMESGGVLDAYEGGSANGTPIYSNRRNGATNQRWTVQEDDDGALTFRNIDSGRCLDYIGDAVAGTPLQIWDCDDVDTQRWAAQWLGNNEYQLRNLENQSLCLNVSGGQPDINTPKRAILWDCNNTPNERWIFTPSWPYTFATEGPWDFSKQVPGPVSVESLKAGGLMDVDRRHTDNDSLVVQYHRTRQPNQGWYLSWSDSQTVTFKGVQSGRCLDIHSSDTAEAGREAVIFDCHPGQASQQWRVEQLRGAEVMFHSVARPDLCLDVHGGPVDPDQGYLDVWPCSSHADPARNQTWLMTPYDPSGDPVLDPESDWDDPTSGGGVLIGDAGKPAQRVAYYPSWSVYGNAFYPKDLDTQGIAGKLTTLNYAFENIDPVNLTCFAANKASSSDESDTDGNDGSADAWADYQMSFTTDNSVDGVADTWDQPLKGNFNQLEKLKAKYPNLKVVVSLGGWTYSKYFSDVAATDASRKKFVGSCIDMYIKGDLPTGINDDPAGGTGVAAGVFDGFDIDWEFPGSANGHTGNHVSAQDGANYTLLLQEFRTELDALGGGKHYQLTAALPAGPTEIGRLQVGQLAAALDMGDVMAYDFHGAFEANGPTDFQSPIFDSPESPANGTQFTANDAVNNYLTQGFPAGKLTLGVPLYGRGWTGVPDGGKSGLYQSVTGPTAAYGFSQSPGVVFYKELKADGKLTGGNVHFDPQTYGSWVYDGTDFWSIESPLSLAYKRQYIKNKGLGGVMMYSLEADDSTSTLLNAATGYGDLTG
ncbi:glycosyl hydrolase family 18 protein [Streptomyces sp. NPDC092296]|uniref:glycosyl hydrolase family 18 protein n=1 Tax=Streptomyces sp. NPDC092296 TaxID=3366012 RepID=UPI0038126C82